MLFFDGYDVVVSTCHGRVDTFKCPDVVPLMVGV